MNAVSLMHAEAGSSPSGTGSYNYFTNCSVVVQNIAFTKVVGVWGHTNSGNWAFFPCIHSRSVPGNNEVWQAHIDGTEIDQFAIEYQVAGNIYWDNNSGYDYRLATGPAHTDGIGTVVINPNVLVVAVDVDPSGNLKVEILVKNINFAKTVAITYTTDNWTTFHNVFGSYKQSYPPAKQPHQVDAELWEVTVPVGVGTTGSFAAFYIVDGATYWDNNFTLNYSFP
jgi:hypothetical protein